MKLFPQVGQWWVGVDEVLEVLASFLLCLEGSVFFHCDGSLGDDAAPAGSIGGK